LSIKQPNLPIKSHKMPNPVKRAEKGDFQYFLLTL